MKNFLTNRSGALMTILILAVGSISGLGTAHFVMADQIGKVCVIFACGNATINEGTSGGGGGGGSNTATLIVTKVVVDCPPGALCPPSAFQIKISGVTALPDSFPGDAAGTKVTVFPGKYTVSDTPSISGFVPSFSGNCQVNADGKTASGIINAGETQKCTVTNKFSP